MRPCCGYCRIGYGSHVQDIVGLHPIAPNLPPFLENPSDYLPSSPPKADVVIPIGIHPDILAEISSVVAKCGAKAVIVPIEKRVWCLPALRARLQDELSALVSNQPSPSPFAHLRRVEVRLSTNSYADTLSADLGSKWSLRAT